MAANFLSKENINCIKPFPFEIMYYILCFEYHFDLFITGGG